MLSLRADDGENWWSQAQVKELGDDAHVEELENSQFCSWA
jgi:hypothetical protein